MATYEQNRRTLQRGYDGWIFRQPDELPESCDYWTDGGDINQCGECQACVAERRQMWEEDRAESQYEDMKLRERGLR